MTQRTTKKTPLIVRALAVIGTLAMFPWIGMMGYLLLVVGPTEGRLSQHFLRLEGISFLLAIPFIFGGAVGLAAWMDIFEFFG